VVISASRKTDIPAFYGDWLLNRLAPASLAIQLMFGANLDVFRVPKRKL
jgi:hypothetical protein